MNKPELLLIASSGSIVFYFGIALFTSEPLIGSILTIVGITTIWTSFQAIIERN